MSRYLLAQGSMAWHHASVHVNLHQWRLSAGGTGNEECSSAYVRGDSGDGRLGLFPGPGNEGQTREGARASSPRADGRALGRHRHCLTPKDSGAEPLKVEGEDDWYFLGDSTG